MDSKATLVVCPAQLVDHWQSEIQKHVHPLRPPGDTMEDPNSHGLRCHIFRRSWSDGSVKVPTLSPTQLKALTSQDVVLIGNDMVSKELFEPKTIRRKTSGDMLVEPLTSVKFWRVVVDEAQSIGEHLGAQVISSYLSHGTHASTHAKPAACCRMCLICTFISSPLSFSAD